MKNPVKMLRMALSKGLVCATLALAPFSSRGQEAGPAFKGEPVNFSELAAREKGANGGKAFQPTHKRLQKEPRNLPVDGAGVASPRRAASIESVSPPPETLPIPSPAPSLSVVALPDDGTVAPPDTSGAVGPGHLVVACASDLRVQDRFGNVLSSVSQETFWAGVAANVFDTRIVFDPYGQRFIMTAAADPGGANPRLCIAVTANANPTSTWYRWSEDVDATSPIYADAPNVGFNRTWIVVQANMFNKNTFGFVRSDVYAYNKANLYANGAGQRTRLSFDASFGGSQVPASMYDSNNAVVFFVKDWNGAFTNEVSQETSGFLRVFWLGGGIGSERIIVTNAIGSPVFAEVGRTWSDTALNDRDILPQLNNTNKIYAGDSRIQNVHFRDGLLYAAQTVFLPTGNPNHAAVQWWAITGGGVVQHFDRVDDPGGTNMFAYPSIAANRYQDVLVGYSRFSPLEYPSAAYSFRVGDDPTDELRGEIILKPGDASYDVVFSGQNRWGDWSATTVDPVNDVDLWTIQEYAAARSPTGGSRWGTWWGRVSPPVDMAITKTGSSPSVPSGSQITYTLQVTNKLDQILSGVRVQDTLPAGMSFVSATTTKGSCGHTNGVVSCFVGPMVEFERQTITITAMTGLPATVTNTAIVLANGPDMNPADNTATAITEVAPAADLQVQGTDSPDPVHVGNTLTYTLTILNNGPSAAGGVVLTSTMPAAVSIGSISPSQGICSNNGNVINCTLGVINNGSTATITISGTANSAGNVANQVRVAASTADIVPGNNTVSIATKVNARPVINPIGTQNINEDVAAVVPVTISDAENAAGSLQLSATSSNPTIIPNANIVPGGSGSARNLTITSAANQFGSNVTVTVTVTDLDGASTSLPFTVNVAAVNDAPTISDIANPAPIAEDGATPDLSFTVGDIDNFAPALTMSGNSSNPTLVPVANIAFTGSGSSRFVTVTPAANRSGTATITATVSDGARTASDTFVVTVNPVNDPPTISDILDQSTTEDTATATIPFTVSDIETGGTTLSVTATSGNTALVPNGNIALVNNGNDRTIRLTPALNQTGLATITVVVSDGTNSQSTVFDLTVDPVNDRPTLMQPGNVTRDEDSGRVTVNLTGIGSGAPNENQVLTVTASTPTPDMVENLQVTYNSPDPTGTLTFDLVADAWGTGGRIDVRVSDGNPADDLTRQFTVNIDPINDPPTIDGISNVFVLEDSGQHSITLTGITAGPANETGQTNTITADSSAPGIVPDPQIIYVPGATTATLRFTPVGNASGVATITVTVNDGRPANNTANHTFQISVDAVNDLPTISQIGDRTIAEDGAAGPIPFNFRDVEPGALTVTGTSSNQGLVPNANVEITGTGTNRNLTVTPLSDQFGTATITVRVLDADGDWTDETFLLTVTAVNDPPTLAAITNPAPIPEDASAQMIDLTGIAPGPSNESTQVVRITASSSNPAIVPHPTVNYNSPSAAGFLTYAPAANATGSVTITVTANDQESVNNTIQRNFTVQVNSVNDAPTISDFTDEETDEDVAKGVNFTVGDVETAAGNLTLSGSSSNLELVENTGITFGGSGGNRTITVRPLTNASGFAFIFITVTDAHGGVTESGFGLTVLDVDDPPLISTVSPPTIAEDAATGTLAFWVNDADTPLANLTITANSSNPALVPNASTNIELGGNGTNRNVRVTPVSNGHGSATITLQVGDGNANRTSQFTVTVTPVNDQPTLDDIVPNPLNLSEDAGQQLLTLTGVSSGAANENDTLAVTAVSSVPALIPNPVGTNDNGVWKLRFTPVANASGSANITVTINDGQTPNPTISKSFTVNVQAVNDPPTLNTISNPNLNEDAAAQNITLTGISAGGGENQALSFTVSSGNPALVPQPTVSYTNGSSTAVLRLTVAPNSTGSSLITVRLSDGAAETVQTFTVTVNPVNEPPAISSIGPLSTPEDVPVSAAFTIADEETYAARLTLSATSGNTTLVPNANIVFNGSDGSRWVTINPATNASGSAQITLTVSDGTNNVSTQFNVTVASTNDPPTLNILTNVAVVENPSTFSVNLSGITAGGGESQTLTVRVNSSNTSLIPTPSVSYTSPNATGSISVNPANSGTGSSVITVTVSDNGSPSNGISRSFTVHIRPSANTVPTLTGLSNQTTPEDTGVTLPFTVGDSSTPVASLVVGALSSNPDLVPTNSIVFGGSGASRNVTITPLPNRSGASTLTIWVMDSQFGYTASNIVFTVTSLNDRPTISAIAPQTISRGTNMPPVHFTIDDAETPALSLSLSATSSNPTLLPNANIILGGSGTNRSVMAYPVSGQTGTANITITVTDASALSTNTSFALTVRVPQPPALTIRHSGPNIELLWPTADGLYTVQSRDSLATGSWTDVAATPTTIGANYVVTLPLAGPQKFFRLRN